jgi:Ribbon-helix-helix protein, copG family
MIHKQISLPEELSEQIEERAKRLHTSEERVIRDLLSLGLSLGVGNVGKSWGNSGEALRTLGELHIAGPSDLAQRHDEEYLSESP